jgi:hypothetical protein
MLIYVSSLMMAKYAKVTAAIVMRAIHKIVCSCEPFSPEPSALSFAIQEHKHWNIKDYNFACVSV